jgi:hypothetical protein
VGAGQGDGQGVGGVIGTGNGFEAQKHLDHALNLAFLGAVGIGLRTTNLSPHP